MLHLIGTVHTDIHGKERLRKAVDKLKPDLITVEATKKEFNQQYMDMITENLLSYFYTSSTLFDNITSEQFDEIERLVMTYGFEVKTCLELQKEGYRIEPIDIETSTSAFESRRFSGKPLVVHEAIERTAQEILTLDINIEIAFILANYIVYGTCDKDYSDSHINFMYDLKAERVRGKESLKKRDTKMNEGIRKFYNPDITLMNIGGVGHLYGINGNLYRSLSDLNPIRHRLSEFD